MTDTDTVERVDQVDEHLPAGTLVHLADDPTRHAVLCGYGEDGFPLVVDLVSPRSHHSGVTRA